MSENTMDTLPKVSICIPTYNQAEFLPQALESALNQTFKDIEIVVSVNHCTDDTEDILKKYSNLRLKIVRPTRFLKMAENWSFCVSHSSGEYFNLLSSDDILLPEFAAEQVNLLDQHPNVAFTHCACERIDKKGQVIGKEKSIHPGFYRSGERELKRYIYGPRCVFVSAMIRRTAYDQVGGFRSLKIIGDWDLWLRLLQVGAVIYNQHILAQYRSWLDTDGMRSNYQRLLVHAKEVLALYKEQESVILKKYPDLKKDFIKAKNKQARSFVYGLASISDSALQKQVKDVLLELSRDWRVRLMLSSLNLGLGPALLAWKKFKLSLRQNIKALLYPKS